MIIEVQILISIDHIFEVQTLLPDLLIGNLRQIDTIALTIELRGILRAIDTARREREIVAQHIGVAIHQEGLIGTTTQAHGCSLEVAGRGIEIDSLHIAQVGRRSNRQLILGLVGVVLATNNRQLALATIGQPTLAVSHHCNLAQRHTVNNRNRSPAHTRLVAFHIEDRTINVETIGIGTIQHDHMLTLLGASLHQSEHSYIIGVETQTYVLNVDNQHVERGHILVARTCLLAIVERTNGNTRTLINRTRHVLTCVSRTTETVLGSEDTRNVEALVVHNINDMAITNDTRMVRHYSHTLTLDQWVVLAGLLSTDLHALAGKEHRGQHQRSHEKKCKSQMFHKS